MDIADIKIAITSQSPTRPTHPPRPTRHPHARASCCAANDAAAAAAGGVCESSHTASDKCETTTREMKHPNKGMEDE